MVGKPSTPTFDTWRSRTFDSPTFLPDGFFVAVAGANAMVGATETDATYVGLTFLNEGLANAWEYYQGLTGVRTDYRQRGIALALKIRAIEFAKHNGKTQIKTFNGQQNTGMLRINEMVGFKRQPPWITLVKNM
jgi:predicted GNAT superfamily acetyltransferase